MKMINRLVAVALCSGTFILSSNADKVQLESLPAGVREGIRAQTGTAQIEDIDRKVTDGKTTYEVAFKRNGTHTELIFNDQGQLQNNASGIRSATAGNVSPNAIQLSNKQKVAFSSLPAAVQQAATAAAKGAKIEDAERGQWRARTIYEIAFKDQGQHVELQVEENGKIAHDPRTHRATAAGVPAAGATGVSRSSVHADVTSAVNLSSGQKVQRNALPPAVEQALKTQAPGAQIEDIERGTWRGMNVYQAAFKDQGKHVELQIDEKGNVVFDPRKK